MLAGAFAAFEVGCATGSVAAALGAAMLAASALALALRGLRAVAPRRSDRLRHGAERAGARRDRQRVPHAPPGGRGARPRAAARRARPRRERLHRAGARAWSRRGRAVPRAHAARASSLRAVGERAEAAHAQGIAVLRVRLGATLFGGACAGLAGRGARALALRRVRRGDDERPRLHRARAGAVRRLPAAAHRRRARCCSARRARCSSGCRPRARRSRTRCS